MIARFPERRDIRCLSVLQDYSHATAVRIRGQATLMLQSNKTAIRMDSESTAVANGS